MQTNGTNTPGLISEAKYFQGDHQTQVESSGIRERPDHPWIIKDLLSRTQTTLTAHFGVLPQTPFRHA